MVRGSELICSVVATSTESGKCLIGNNKATGSEVGRFFYPKAKLSKKMWGNTKVGHKFKPGVYEPLEKYPQLVGPNDAVRFVKVEECPCGCWRVMFKMTETTAQSGRLYTTYYVGNVQQPKAPRCLIDSSALD